MANEKIEQPISGKEIITSIVAAVELIQLFKNKGGEMKKVATNNYKEFQNNPLSAKDILIKALAEAGATVTDFATEKEKQKIELKSRAVVSVMEMEAKLNELAELKKEKANLEHSAGSYYQQAATRFTEEKNDDEESIREKLQAWTKRINQVRVEMEDQEKQKSKNFFASLFGEK